MWHGFSPLTKTCYAGNCYTVLFREYDKKKSVHVHYRCNHPNFCPEYFLSTVGWFCGCRIHGYKGPNGQAEHTLSTDQQIKKVCPKMLYLPEK